MLLVQKVAKAECPAQADLVSPGSIQERIEALDSIDAEMQRLKDGRRKMKADLDAMIYLVDLNGQELRDFVFNTYWSTKHVSAVTLRSMVKQRFGNDREWYEIVAGTLEVVCEVCGKKYTKEYRSRTQYNADKNGTYAKDLTCQGCKADCKAKRQARIEQENRERQESSTTRISALRELPYQEYLQTDHWQETRKRALKRAGFKCQLCSSNGKLHVHHRTYENLGNENNADLIVLCETCHGKFHNKVTEGKDA